MIIALIFLFVWGWPAVKNLFGITAIGALLSRNIMIGCVLFVFYLMIAYLFGIFVALLGTGRYIYLKVAMRGGR